VIDELYPLYQEAVQSPEADVDFFERVYAQLRGGSPTTLREDFAGTALLTRTWLESDPDRRAWAVDIDPEPLDWGRQNNLSAGDLAERVEIIVGDVLDVTTPPVDITAALNFSCCILRQREDLKRYLGDALANLADEGLLVLDLYGGTEAIIATTEERDLDGFSYMWEQASFNPITHEGRCKIHFILDDGTRHDDAFVYDWRLWTIPEMRQLMLEVGFEDMLVFWEAVDDNGDGTGDYLETTEEENQEGWLVYLVGVK
jgi:hypothetical protein